ncbi:MAG TPA: glycosyltransferase family 4 protein [Candidatus Acidoferrales bacterium]|nr:glycosyltransferase family 4 protein [Candidatus Acidoferrales bacterium]
MNDEESQISLLTAGRDRPYALGLAAALAAAGKHFDFVGSNEVDGPELHESPRIHFLNLRGDQSLNAGVLQKIIRVLAYYGRLIRYAFTARPRIFHILWNNKFEMFDRTALMLWYKLLGKKIVFTAHNVNARARDGGDSFWNRATLKFQYRHCDHIFLHTERMRSQLIADFGVPAAKTTVIPFGLNSTVPDTALTGSAARRRLGLGAQDKVLLFFGNIAPYKGLEYLVDAFVQMAVRQEDLRLIIAGRPKGGEADWSAILGKIEASAVRDRMVLKIEFVPDAETEVYFKAADVLILPYTHVFQSGVLFLGYNFGLPALAADVGSLKEEIVEGQTGFVFPPRDVAEIVRAVQRYFVSDLYGRRESHRAEIRQFAQDRYSWSKVARMTAAVYDRLQGN